MSVAAGRRRPVSAAAKRRVSRAPHIGSAAELKAQTGASTLDEVFLSLTGHDIEEKADTGDLEEVRA